MGLQCLWVIIKNSNYYCSPKSQRSEVSSCTSQFGKLFPSPIILDLTLSSLLHPHNDFFFQIELGCVAVGYQPCTKEYLLDAPLGYCQGPIDITCRALCMGSACQILTDANNNWASWSSWSTYLSCISWICVCLDFSFHFDIDI